MGMDGCVMYLITQLLLNHKFTGGGGGGGGAI